MLDAVAYKKSKGMIPANAEMLPIPTKPGDPGIVIADDVRSILQNAMIPSPSTWLTVPS